MSETETPEPDASDIWYSERQARLNEAAARIDAQKTALSSAYQSLESQWQEVHRREEEAHDLLETRDITRLQREKMRIESEAQQLQGGWQALINEERQVYSVANLSYDSLLEGSSEASRMFLMSHADQLGDQASLRRLTYADSVARQRYKPDSKEYFAALEEHMGLSPEDRKTDFLDRQVTTRSRKSKEPKLTHDQLQMARNLDGITEKEYLGAVNKSLGYDPSDNTAADNYRDPGLEVDTGKEPAMEYQVVEEPKATKKYRVDPNSKTAIKLSKEEVEICEATGVKLADYARNKLDLHAGRTSHQLYAQKLASSMGAKYR